jgi:hypothetical protein
VRIMSLSDIHILTRFSPVVGIRHSGYVDVFYTVGASSACHNSLTHEDIFSYFIWRQVSKLIIFAKNLLPGLVCFSIKNS